MCYAISVLYLCYIFVISVVYVTVLQVEAEEVSEAAMKKLSEVRQRLMTGDQSDHPLLHYIHIYIPLLIVFFYGESFPLAYFPILVIFIHYIYIYILSFAPLRLFLFIYLFIYLFLLLYPSFVFM